MIRIEKDGWIVTGDTKEEASQGVAIVQNALRIVIPTTLSEAIRYFRDVQMCHDYMVRIKWPDGKIRCPACESLRVGNISSRRMLQCKDCRKQFSVKVGTIFEDSPLGLDKWFVAVWVTTNASSVSSRELGRSLDVTQKTAWFMLNRIRRNRKIAL